MLARCAAFDEIGIGDQSMAEGNLFDDIGIIARPAVPLVDDVDQTDMFTAVEAGVHQIRSVDVEDHESSRTTGWAGWRTGELGGRVMSLFHAVIMTKGCCAVV